MERQKPCAPSSKSAVGILFNTELSIVSKYHLEKHCQFFTEPQHLRFNIE